MRKNFQIDSHRIDILIAFIIAIVSITLALLTWRISVTSSKAGDANRQGILDAIKQQAAANESWRKTYEEASYAENYAAYLAGVEVLETSDDPAAKARAAHLRQYLLPSLQLLASPLASESVYQNPDGTYRLQERFNAIQAADVELRDLDPQKSFLLADRYYAEQRWLTAVAVLLAISLFWLTLAEIGSKRLRLLTLIVGVIVYGVGLAALGVIEVLFFFLRGGVL